MTITTSVRSYPARAYNNRVPGPYPLRDPEPLRVTRRRPFIDGGSIITRIGDADVVALSPLTGGGVKLVYVPSSPSPSAVVLSPRV